MYGRFGMKDYPAPSESDDATRDGADYLCNLRYEWLKGLSEGALGQSAVLRSEVDKTNAMSRLFFRTKEPDSLSYLPEIRDDFSSISTSDNIANDIEHLPHNLRTIQEFCKSIVDGEDSKEGDSIYPKIGEDIQIAIIKVARDKRLRPKIGGDLLAALIAIDARNRATGRAVPFDTSYALPRLANGVVGLWSNRQLQSSAQNRVPTLEQVCNAIANDERYVGTESPFLTDLLKEQLEKLKTYRP